MKTTDELLKVLRSSHDINQFLEQNIDNLKETNFMEHLNLCLKRSELSKAEVIEKSNIQKNYGYQDRKSVV